MKSKELYMENFPLESRVAILKLELLRRANYAFIWTTSDGRNIPVTEMDTQHIKNAIRRLKKSIEIHKELEELRDTLPESLDEIY